MTRTEYLAQLEKYLKKLPAKDYQEAMDYFTEYFNEVDPEGEAAAIVKKLALSKIASRSSRLPFCPSWQHRWQFPS